MNKLVIFLVFLGALSTWNCSSSRYAKTQEEKESSSRYPDNASLAQILTRTPGLIVSGTGDNVQVRVRGLSTISGDPSPLYVLDGSVVGTSYDAVSQLNGYEIASIRVLKDAVSTTRYGMMGASGVIEIRTKR